MDEDIAHSSHLAPWDFGMLLPKERRNLLGDLTQYFQTPDNGIDGLFVRSKRLVIHPAGELINVGDGVADVVKIIGYFPPLRRTPPRTGSSYRLQV